MPQRATFEAGLIFARTEGIIPAPESNHAIRVAIDEALGLQADRRAARPFSSISPATAISTWRHTTAYLSGKLEDSPYPDEAMKMALAELPKVVQQAS